MINLIQININLQHKQVHKMKRHLWISDINDVKYDIFNLPKGKHLIFKGIRISGLQLTELPDLSSVEVGLFDCSDNNLKSLIGSPKVVHGDFHCNGNQLMSFESTTYQIGTLYCHNNPAPSLEGIPQDIVHIICGSKEFNSLRGAPSRIKGTLRCAYSSITDLEGCPQEIGGNLELCGNHFLENLKGGPKVVGRSVKIEDCEKLTSLEGGPKEVGSLDLFKDEGEYAGQFFCKHSGLTSLKGAPEVVYGTFYVGGVPQKISSLEGAPKVVYGRFIITQRTPVLSLEGAPQIISPRASFLSDWEFHVAGQPLGKYLQYIRSLSPSEKKLADIKEQLRKQQLSKTPQKIGEDATEAVQGKRELPQGVKMSKCMKRGEFDR